MAIEKTKSDLSWEIYKFVRGGFPSRFEQPKSVVKSKTILNKLCEAGSELWLDTGSLSEAREFWTREFTALTTNNTLLNKEIQTGRYDMLIIEAARLLAEYPQISAREKMLEIVFVLNSWRGMRLALKFDAYVSVEEHTDIANDIDQTVEYANRYYAICPQRFTIKIRRM